MTKKSDSSWFQFDSSVVWPVTYIRKRIFTKTGLLCHLPGPFCVAHAHWKPILNLCLNAEFKSNRVKHSH